jgi:putative ABC transport system permease protein
MATIVGVARSVRLRGPERVAWNQLYVPYDQSSATGTMYIAIKARGDASVLPGAVREALGRVDSGLPAYNMRTFDEVRSSYIADRRFAMAVMSAFALLATLLSAIGLYGVMGYLVQLRVREIGIRIAFGATPGSVLGDTMKSGLLYAATGVIAGAAVAAASSRIFISRVPGLAPLETTTLLATAAGMLVLAACTIWFPARRAARIHPIDALRTE